MPIWVAKGVGKISTFDRQPTFYRSFNATLKLTSVIFPTPIVFPNCNDFFSNQISLLALFGQFSMRVSIFLIEIIEILSWHVEMTFLIKTYGFFTLKILKNFVVFHVAWFCHVASVIWLLFFIVYFILLRFLIWKRILDYRLSRLVWNSEIKRIRQLIDRWMLNQILSIKLIVRRDSNC